MKGLVDMKNEEILSELIAGNLRFVNSSMIHPHTSIRRRGDIKDGQHPIAAVLSCSDSRVPPEIVFDMGLGDLYVVRVAGNVLDQMIIASIEYAVLHLEVSVVIVMGHSKCGAVAAACKHEELEGHLPSLTFALNSAVNKAKGVEGDFLENTVLANVEGVVEEIKQTGSHFPTMVKSGNLLVIGAYYDIDTGKVGILGNQ